MVKILVPADLIAPPRVLTLRALDLFLHIPRMIPRRQT